MHRSFLKSLFIAVVTALSLTLSPSAFAQGVVSSTVTGTLLDSAGKSVAGASVTATHLPTNTTFRAVTNPNGRFSLTGLPVGGPYSISATADGYTVQSLDDVQTSLAENTDVVLAARTTGKEEVVQLEKFTVTGGVSDLDANATGASSVLSNRRMLAQPSVNRAFTDLIKTNPFVSVRGYPQVEALGINSRYNTITLDGAKINDSFGLNASGLFSLNNPFSLDAVEQFSVSLTPYDVRQSGFAGASVNAVSKSGTNEFHGTAYDLFTDMNWQGPDEFGSTIHKRSPFKQRTYGYTLGGPILKNRLFFFLNWEKFIQDSAPTNAGITPDQAFLDAVQAKIAALPGTPKLGTWGGSSTTREFDTKRLAKLDWNITQDHRLSVRYSDTVGIRPNFGTFNFTSFSQPLTPTNQPSLGNLGTGLTSSFYNIAVNEKVLAGQLFSNWSPNFKTEVDYSSTKQDSVRSTPIAFPNIRIFNVPAKSSTGSTVTANDAFQFGTETSSMGNELHVKTKTINASGDYTWKNFTFSGGADHESSDYFNLFRQGSYGYFSYWNLAAFQNDTPFAFDRAVVQTGTPTADISKFTRTGVFGQAKWEPTARLNLILGLRMDYVGSPIAPAENATFKSVFGITNSGTVDGTSTPQPRFSFNLAVDQKRTMQIRGGVGVFLGRNPWVWISNSYGNTGVGRFNNFFHTPTGTPPNTAAYAGPTLAQYLQGTYTNSDPSYKFDPANPVGTTAVAGTASSINLVKPGMKLPTIMRGNLALDRKLPGIDSVLSFEYINTDQLDALFVENLNLNKSTTGADGRQRFSGSNLSTSFANVIRTRNIHAGKSNYAALSLDHPFKNHWAWNVAYTRGQATEATSLNSSTANSQFNFNPVFNQNTVEIARSDYEVKDRIQATISREFVLHKDYVTTVSLYYEGRSGQPYSWVYSGDVNGDTVTGNDLIAVPRDTADSRFDFSGMTPDQQNGYFRFLSSNGLAKYAGGSAPRNAFLGPWQNKLDLSFRQEVPLYSVRGKNIKMEFFLDFLNFGSWLSKSIFNYVEEINTGTTFGGLTRVLGNATYNATGQIKPTFTADSFSNVALPASSLITVNNGDTRWRIQGGVKLKF